MTHVHEWVRVEDRPPWYYRCACGAEAHSLGGGRFELLDQWPPAPPAKKGRR